MRQRAREGYQGVPGGTQGALGCPYSGLFYLILPYSTVSARPRRGAAAALRHDQLLVIYVFFCQIVRQLLPGRALAGPSRRKELEIT